MAVTKYYSYNGMVIGESTSGTHTTYGLDALGSAVATYSSGAPENAYVWAPYGTLLQKTGTGNDPKFGWNGSSGYWTTGRRYSTNYVRARSYDSLTAAWIAVDPLWPIQSAYSYAPNPLTHNDPSGALQEQAHGDELEFCSSLIKDLKEAPEGIAKILKCLKNAKSEEEAKECLKEKTPEEVKDLICKNLVAYLACLITYEITPTARCINTKPFSLCSPALTKYGYNMTYECCVQNYYTDFLKCTYCPVKGSGDVGYGACLQAAITKATYCGFDDPEIS